ncbi:armadillo-type protein [Syncephalis fuscata]|nr:armadillo-type protein [Syncephalis fuscata]
MDTNLNEEKSDIDLLKETAVSGKDASDIATGQESKTKRIDLIQANAIATSITAAVGGELLAQLAGTVDNRIQFAKCLVILIGNPDNEIQDLLKVIASSVDVAMIKQLLQALAELSMNIATRLLTVIQDSITDTATSVQYLVALQPCTAPDLPEGIRAEAMQAVLRILTYTDTNNIELAIAFVQSNGFEQLLLASAEATQNRVRGLALLLLAKLNENSQMAQQKNSPANPLRTAMEKQCTALIEHWIEHEQITTRVAGFRVLCALFQIDSSLAIAALGSEGAEKLADTTELADYEAFEAQLALTETLSYACDDKACRSIIAVRCRSYLLARLREVNSVPMRIAAAVALTKIAHAPSDNGSTTDTAHRAILVQVFYQALHQPSEDGTINARAVEGLTYFSLDPTVKEQISKDTALLKGLNTLIVPAVTPNAANQLNNTTLKDSEAIKKVTSYGTVYTKNPSKKAKEAAQIVDNPLDDDKQVEQRTARLLKEDMLSVILKLAKHTSQAVRGSATRCLLSIVTDKTHRGTVIQRGGVRILLSLATERIPIPGRAVNNDADPASQPYVPYAELATQALAKLAITVDPRIGFPGELAKELVRPFVRICADQEQPALRQFECLLALTNLASVSEDSQIAQRIVDTQGVEAASTLQFSRITLVQRAATELICNLMMYPAVGQLYSASTERIKLLVALADAEDTATRSAAAGALAILSAWPQGARAILNGKQSVTRLVALLTETDDGLQHRGAECLRNIVALDKAAAAQVVQAKAVPSLIETVKTSQHPPLLQCVAQILASLKQYHLLDI